MDSKIIDLDKFKFTRNLIANYQLPRDPSYPDPGELKLEKLKIRFLETTASLLELWKERVVDNSLNDFVISTLQEKYLIDKTLKYSSDLNAISKLEKHVGLNPIVIGPGSSPANPIGWSSAFYFRGLLMSTPEFSTEVYARCFNMLLFIALSKKQK